MLASVVDAASSVSTLAADSKSSALTFFLLERPRFLITGFCVAVGAAGTCTCALDTSKLGVPLSGPLPLLGAKKFLMVLETDVRGTRGSASAAFQVGFFRRDGRRAASRGLLDLRGAVRCEIKVSRVQQKNQIEPSTYQKQKACFYQWAGKTGAVPRSLSGPSPSLRHP